MPREPFNDFADVFAGPGTATPGALRATVPCRVVQQTGITLIGPDHPIRVAWITMQGIVPRGAWGHPEAQFDPSVADQIAVPSGSLPQYWVLYTEEVFWRSQPLYYRANVAYLPLLPDGTPGPGGGPWALGSALLLFGDKSGSGAEAVGELVFGSTAGVLAGSTPSGTLLFRNEP